MLINRIISKGQTRSKIKENLAFFVLIALIASSIVLTTNLANSVLDNSHQTMIPLEKIGGCCDNFSFQNTSDTTDSLGISSEENSISNEEVVMENISGNLPSGHQTWLEHARNTPFMRINTANGSLQVNTQTGSTILSNTPIEIYNSTNSVVASGLSNGGGNFTISELLVGNYTVIIQKDTNITVEIEINEGDSKTILANFGRLQITTEDEGGSPVEAIVELRDFSDSSLEASNIQIGPSGDIILIVAPIIYDVNAFYGYGQSQSSIVVTEGILSVISFVFGSIEGKFGSIVVSSHGYYDMPLSSAVTIRNYTSGAIVASGSTNSYTGIGTWTLAPDIYTVEVTETTRVINESVVVEANIQTNITVSFGLLIVYQDNTTNNFVEVYNELNTVRLTYDWISGTTKLVAMTLAKGTYNIHYSSQNHLITIGKREKILINSQINTAPSLLSISASPSRIYANETTNLTVSVGDVNYDYDNIEFHWYPNVGAISG
ncbi:MAG: hypothetical protein ACW99A_20740, partial [Candidatus Kariarchaeaceae archaeon]